MLEKLNDSREYSSLRVGQCLWGVLIILLWPTIAAAAIYKYKDVNGHWVFTDAKGRDTHAKEVEELHVNIKPVEVASFKPFVTHSEQGYALQIDNPYHGPLQTRVAFIDGTKKRIESLIEAPGITTLYRSDDPIEIKGYQVQVGDPKPETVDVPYLFPVRSSSTFKITQGFHGQFSHFKLGSRYAVDIAMQVGTYIAAARAGTVMWVKQDYYMGGKRKYFLDKANVIKILHDDGTYAVYAHILQDSALVQAGDTVKAGQAIARSGSSGFSTGPHLHFVIRKNIGFKTVSLPFKFKTNDGQVTAPEKGQYYRGQSFDGK